MPFRHAADPRRVFRVARAVAWLCLPASAVLLIGWLAGFIPGTEQLRMIYQTILWSGLGAMIVASLAACQLAIHNAFAAGFKTGQASVWPDDEDTLPGHMPPQRGPGDPLLRLVD